jgi:Glycosyl transferases group 1
LKPCSMKISDPLSAVFVSAAVALKAEGGGVQRCTREYLEVLRAAGLQLHTVAYPFEHRLWVRILRKFRKRPYRDAIPRGFVDEVRKAVADTNAGWILINQTEAAPLIPELAGLRQQGVRIALLSHGTDSCDYIHLARTRAEFHQGRPISSRDKKWIGGLIFEEQIYHRLCDAVFCLSETDRQLEQWLGGRNVTVLPRVIDDRTLPWSPVAGRIGTVGTLTHGPNYEGLVLFCRALVRKPGAGITLRLVGTPDDLGRKLASEFPFVEFLGGLSDVELAREAQTWCAFLNPLFCYPRGCSTKLAVPLEWRIPVATTRAGARGYVWDENLIPLVETPEELAALAVRLCSPDEALHQREAVIALAAKSPGPADLAEIVRATLR